MAILTDDDLADILMASAHSSRPMKDDTIRQLATALGHNPDATVAAHDDMKATQESLASKG